VRLEREKAKPGKPGAGAAAAPKESPGKGVPDVNCRRDQAEAAARAKTPVNMTRGLVVDDELKLEKSAAQAANARGQHQL
jgi:hypothetical protein